MVTVGIIMKGRCIIIPLELQKQTPGQLNSNHMVIEKTRQLAGESVYWVNMNDDIENTVKHCSMSSFSEDTA